MNKLNRILLLLAASFLALSVAACGNDDNSDSSNFTKSNSKAIATAVLHADDTSEYTMPAFPGGGNAKPMTVSEMGVPVGAVSTKTGMAEIFACPGGGTYSIEYLGNAGTEGASYEVGNGFKVTYTHCIFIDSPTYNGYFQYIYIDIQGSPVDEAADWLLSIEYTYDFTVTAYDGTSDTRAGSFVQTISYNKANNAYSHGFTANDLSYQIPAGGTITWLDGSSYQLTYYSNGSTGFSINGSAVYESATNTFAFTVTTTEAFVRATDGRLIAGEILINNNSDGSSIRLSADANGDLLIEIDSDGDGSYEVTITVNYLAL